MSSRRIVTRSFLLAWIICFLQYLVLYGPMATVALYAMRAYAAGDLEAGFAVTAFMLGAMASRLAAGYLSDVFGARRVLVIALILATGAAAAHFWTDSLWLLILVRAIHGMTYAVASTAAIAIAQRAIPADRRGEGTGYLAIGNGIAAALGPAGALVLYLTVEPVWLFVGLSAVTVASLVCALLIRPEPSDATLVPRRFTWSDALHPAVVPIAVFMLLLGLGYAGVMTYLTAYAEERSLLFGAGMFFASYAIVTVVVRLVLGRVQDRRGDNIVVAIGLAAFVATMLTLALAANDATVIVAGALIGLGYGTLFPAVQAIAVRAADGQRVATAVSTQLFMLDLGVGVSPLLLGPLVSAASYTGLYFGLAVLLVLAGGFYWMVHGRFPEASVGNTAAREPGVVTAGGR